ncbi:MAG: hypothetical protein JWR61_5128 [Ferruginibacter sp.]|uniref:hypothetical protein n=1 Tax=Ferruginibacter sp. TaxID=1940288 RepID=UPI00265B140A|nr:hypothetical protein [Ferruginibacter sp.]MDB5280173.1 hypothetical protein [Ferruginibacter sp.]
MQRELRRKFNDNFSEEKYTAFLQQLENLHPGALEFRIAETPVFIPKDFTQKMLDACEDIVDIITAPNFKLLTQKAIPDSVVAADEKDHPEFIAFDFGICETTNGTLEPQLIEMQGFPTLFAFQAFHSAITKTYAELPATYDAYLNGYNETTYLQLLKEIIVGDCNAENVILLEIYPEQQKTRIDFYCTEDMLGIKTVCLTKLIGEGDQLFYELDGKKTLIKKIYNRLIFDDLYQQEYPDNTIDIAHPWNVEWIPHPNWFYRVSKYTLPLIDNPYVPPTFYLNKLNQIPEDLENYVLKPLFSFAGMGVIIDVTIADINKITDPENWILQRKVKYADVIETPDVPAKAEIRLFYFWKKEWNRPIAVHNLARLSKGKMIGTRYNADKTWVGGTVAFFER